MQNMFDNLWGSSIFTVNCWSFVHWHPEKQQLWKNPGETNKPSLRIILNWPTNVVKERQAIMTL